MPCRSRKNAMHRENAMQSKIERGRFLLDQGFPKIEQGETKKHETERNEKRHGFIQDEMR
jgi:hypothetical protein